MTLNLNKTYSKVAEVIGVDTQYNESKIPLNNVIERAICIQDSWALTIHKSWNYYMLIECTNDDNDWYQYCVPATMMINNDTVIFYAEMDDNFSIKNRASSTTINNYYTESTVQLGDEFSEIKKIKISLIKFNQKLDIDESYDLPRKPRKTYQTINNPAASTRIIYKDAREKLSFTLQYSNIIVVE